MSEGLPRSLSREVGEFLAGEMRRYRVSQPAMAARIKPSQSQLSKMLRGVAEMDLDTFGIICQTLGLEPAKVIKDASEATWYDLWQEPFVEDGRRRPDAVVSAAQQALTRDAIPSLPEGVKARDKDDHGLAASRGMDQGDLTDDGGGAAR